MNKWAYEKAMDLVKKTKKSAYVMTDTTNGDLVITCQYHIARSMLHDKDSNLSIEGVVGLHSTLKDVNSNQCYANLNEKIGMFLPIKATGQSHGNYVKVTDTKGNTVCRVPWGEGDMEKYQYIEKACNNHYAMLKVLNTVERFLGGEIVFEDCETYEDERRLVRKSVLDIIETVEGK